MQNTEKISQLRSRFVSELRNLENELSRELMTVRKEISRLAPMDAKRSSRRGSAEMRSAGSKNKTVSILTGKICPKCGKKGHDLRWHRWNDKRSAGQNGNKRSA